MTNYKDYDLEEYEVWNIYPKHRWVFNKLQLALDMGYMAGPVPVNPPKEGYYCIRPIYNLFGMGLHATKQWLSHTDNEEIMSQIHPGSFWCEWFDGPHYSIDYIWNNGWQPIHATQGYNNSNDLTHFSRWDKIDPPEIVLPDFLNKLKDTKYLNIEFKDSKIIELHLRPANLTGDWQEIEDATIIIPVWKQTTQDYIEDHKRAGFKFKIWDDGLENKIENYRLGFLYK